MSLALGAPRGERETQILCSRASPRSLKKKKNAKDGLASLGAATAVVVLGAEEPPVKEEEQ